MDQAKAEQLSTYEDSATGIRERFLTPALDGGRTVAVLAEPVGVAARAGWVICHSFGSDFDSLAAFDAALARRLAAAGFASLRFHAQGYGDSELGADHIGLLHQVRGALEASELLCRATRVSDVGFVGALFGGTVSALAADRLPASALGVLEPVVKGPSFLRSRIRQNLTTGLADGQPSAPSEDPLKLAARTGVLELEGYAVRQEALVEIHSMDLVADLSSFGGRSLVLQISRSAQPRQDLERLVRRLSELGGDSRWDVVVDRNALRFGSQLWRQREVGKKVNIAEDMTEAILLKTVSWAEASFAP